MLDHIILVQPITFMPQTAAGLTIERLELHFHYNSRHDVNRYPGPRPYGTVAVAKPCSVSRQPPDDLVVLVALSGMAPNLPPQDL